MHSVLSRELTKGAVLTFPRLGGRIWVATIFYLLQESSQRPVFSFRQLWHKAPSAAQRLPCTPPLWVFHSIFFLWWGCSGWWRWWCSPCWCTTPTPWRRTLPWPYTPIAGAWSQSWFWILYDVLFYVIVFYAMQSLYDMVRRSIIQTMSK